MSWAGFHHPDLSFSVLRRRASEECLDLLCELGEVVATRGWSVMWGKSYPSESAYRSAMYRLRKKGLIAHRSTHAGNPILALTAEGESRRPKALRPERFWDRKWNRIWYLLVYDVPETERPYRSALRGFLRRMKMGCLQGSVWITPNDIRPDYADLVEAGGVSSYAFLFETRTVLGQKPNQIVNQAWSFDRLQEVQADYCRGSNAHLQTLHGGTFTSESLAQLARLDVAAYLRAMHHDPLLPRELWPADYLGAEALRLHREISQEIARRL